MSALHILHCHSTFDAGGKELRTARLMNAFGDRARHTILVADRGALSARDAIAAHVRVDFPDATPALNGKPTLARFRALANYMRRFDLILTYNWGAMDAVMARRVFYRDVPPLVHHEDGFNADEAQGPKIERTLYRRLALPAASAFVVPSSTLLDIARTRWKQPASRLRLIPNGIEIDRFGKAKRTTIPGLRKKRGEIIVGTVAGLRPVKQLPRLVRAAAAIPNVRLVIVGEGPEREAILAEASRTGLGDRLVLPGFLPHPEGFMGEFDIFALSSDSEQAPLSLIEAMAAGLPVVSTNVGDIASMLSGENRAAVVDHRDEAAFGAALLTAVNDPLLRRANGAANRAKAIASFQASTMIEEYRRVYGQAVGRPEILIES